MRSDALAEKGQLKSTRCLVVPARVFAAFSGCAAPAAIPKTGRGQIRVVPNVEDRATIFADCAELKKAIKSAGSIIIRDWSANVQLLSEPAILRREY